MRRTTSIATPVAHLVGPGKLKVVNGRLAFAVQGQPPLRLDPETLRTLLCYGPVGITDEAFVLLFRHEIQVAWMTPAGTRCRGRLVRSDPPTTMVRLLQHQAFADPRRRLEWARQVVAAKVELQLKAVRHYQRHGCAETTEVLTQLHEALQRCASAEPVEQLRGLEGSATAAWFRLFARLLNPPWQFAQRVRRPPTDPVNALLSLASTWLLTRTQARCEAAGLEVYLGGLHEYRPGRPSLACDMMEPLRAPAVERWVLTVCNQGLAAVDDFRPVDGGIHLQPAAFGRMLQSWEEQWQQGGHDQALEQQLESLVAQLRQWAPLEPPAAELDAGL